MPSKVGIDCIDDFRNPTRAVYTYRFKAGHSRESVSPPSNTQQNYSLRTAGTIVWLGVTSGREKKAKEGRALAMTGFLRLITPKGSPQGVLLGVI